MAKPIFLIETSCFCSDKEADEIKEQFESKLPDYTILVVKNNDNINQYKF